MERTRSLFQFESIELVKRKVRSGSGSEQAGAMSVKYFGSSQRDRRPLNNRADIPLSIDKANTFTSFFHRLRLGTLGHRESTCLGALNTTSSLSTTHVKWELLTSLVENGRICS